MPGIAHRVGTTELWTMLLFITEGKALNQNNQKTGCNPEEQQKSLQSCDASQ